jgi:2-oxoisovalerate dehydrogenase E1 component
VLRGFKRTKNQPGFEIINVKAWDYPALIEAYKTASQVAREEHVPVLVHVEEVTQPQGHSTSGSHERYKSDDRLKWEGEYCCITSSEHGLKRRSLPNRLNSTKLKRMPRQPSVPLRKKAWEEYQSPIKQQKEEMMALLDSLKSAHSSIARLEEIQKNLKRKSSPIRKDVISSGKAGTGSRER